MWVSLSSHPFALLLQCQEIAELPDSFQPIDLDLRAPTSSHSDLIAPRGPEPCMFLLLEATHVLDVSFTLPELTSTL